MTDYSREGTLGGAQRASGPHRRLFAFATRWTNTRSLDDRQKAVEAAREIQDDDIREALSYIARADVEAPKLALYRAQGNYRGYVEALGAHGWYTAEAMDIFLRVADAALYPDS